MKKEKKTSVKSLMMLVKYSFIFRINRVCFKKEDAVLTTVRSCLRGLQELLRLNAWNQKRLSSVNRILN